MSEFRGFLHEKLGGPKPPDLFVRLHPSGVGEITTPSGVEGYPVYELMSTLEADPEGYYNALAQRDMFRDCLTLNDWEVYQRECRRAVGGNKEE